MKATITAFFFCICFHFSATAQTRTWVILTDPPDSHVHKKYRFTGGACQKLEVWEYIFGGAHKLTVQLPNQKPAKTAIPAPLPCPVIAQWDDAPLTALRLKDFSPATMEFSDPKDVKLEKKLTLQEAFGAVDMEIEMHFRKQHPDLKKVLEDFKGNLLLPAALNEIKAHASQQGPLNMFTKTG